MRCAWKELLSILPTGMRDDVDAAGKESLEELRLRINAPPELKCSKETVCLEKNITREDIQYVINGATRYSPWTATTAARGYITAPGGHRIGLCGEVISKEGKVVGFRTVRSLCIRVARDFPGIGADAAKLGGSLLILGAPGSGKTTLLRDLIRQLSRKNKVCVVDERCELFPEVFLEGDCPDILTGCPKLQGIPMLLRTMGPDYIAVDEITEEADCLALLQAVNCGVKLLATAHAGSVEEFRRRAVYSLLREGNVFGTVLVLGRDRIFTVERRKTWISDGLVQY